MQPRLFEGSFVTSEKIVWRLLADTVGGVCKAKTVVEDAEISKLRIYCESRCSDRAKKVIQDWHYNT